MGRFMPEIDRERGRFEDEDGESVEGALLIPNDEIT